MKIGIVIGRIGGVDGVALETEKWIEVLRRMGHQVSVLSGELEGELAVPVTLLPELSFDHPDNVTSQRQAYLGESAKEEEQVAALEQQAGQIERGILGWIKQESIECLLAENASALPFHLTMGIALRAVYERTGLPAVTHDHDFRWERGERYESPFAKIRRILEDCFPVSLPNVRHAVINSAADKTLSERLGIEGSVVVPNVMDFERPFGQPDDYSADLRLELGLDELAIPLFQVTRIVRRKGVETAIQLVERFEDERVKLVITGTERDEPDRAYYDELVALARRLGLQERVLFAGDRFDNQRRQTPEGRKVYSLEDAYAHAAACTYFSTYEGFGNAFVEAVVARCPIFVNNYEPVYWPDIGAKGFDTVMIEGGELTAEAVEQAREVLEDPTRRQRMVDHNYALGREHFSFQALQVLLEELFGS
jgi:glycosyltransferase involved in cell wall biosynthesis